ncbi:MAG: T9SS type B sorting domain-containing protein [Flavobacteriales bacterium]|nr:T9SS type B sorting domain-containing protein [Flavobacteriales bacterium]
MRFNTLLLLCSLYFCSILFDQGKLLAQGNSSEQIPFHLWQKESFGYQDPTKEITSKRDQTTKHFMGQNGKMTAHIASGAIHYWKNGEWKTILHSIEPIQGGFQNVHNSFQTTYPERANGELKTILPSGHELLEMKEMKMYLIKNGNVQNQKTINAAIGNAIFDKVNYTDAFGSGIDLLLTQRTNGRKMEFVLNDASSISQFPADAQFLVFEEKVILPGGWNAQLTNQSIHVLDENGLIMARYEQPIFYDTPVHNHENEIHEESYEHRINGDFQISQNGQFLTIRTLVPISWLKSTERQFPIFIDPTINCTPNNTANWTGSHHTISNTNAWAAGSAPYVSTNIWTTYDDFLVLGRSGATDVLHSWAKFNISSLNNTSCVNSVNLNYNVYYNATTQGACRVWTNIRHMNSDPSVAYNAGNNATRLTDIRDGDIYESRNLAIMNGNSGWFNTPLSSNLNHLQTNINNGTGWFAVGFHNYEGANNHNTCYLEIRGYSHANKPYLSVNYTAGYVAQFSNLGPNTFCAGTTQNMSVNVTNIGCKSWTSGWTSPNSVNFSWWGSWQSGQDANPRILPFNSLAPNQSQTITFPVTVPTTPGTYTIYVDLVRDGVCWFRDNTGGCGPGNTSYSITITVIPHSTAPTSISGNSTICQGSSTTLTSQGGTLATDADDAWYVGSCPNECYSNEFASNPTSTTNTTINSNTNGILNVTATNGDAMIHMYNIGSFNATNCRYISIRYRVVSGTGGQMEIYYSKNANQSDLSEAQVARGNIVANGQWNVLNIDMATSANWTGTITGWRFDWCTVNGSRIEIDFITLANIPIFAVGPSITVNPSATTTYFTTKKGQCGNTACVSQTVTVNQNPTLTVNSLTICSGQSATLTATPSVAGGTYSWSQGSTSQSINVSPNSTTSYTASYTVAGCNPVTATGTVTVNPSPSVSVNSVTVCIGSSTTLTATPTVAGGTYAWSTGATTQNIVVNPNATSTYTVTYSSGGCTPSTASGTVTITSAPTVSLNNITICSGETSTLTANPSIGGGTYAWSTGATTNSISVNPTSVTNYSVTYALGACTPATANATVTVNPAPTVAINPITICSGETGNLTATPDQTGGTYAWSTGATTNSISVNPTTTTTYSVTYSLGACTPATANATVTVNPAPLISVTPITICSGETGNLTATPDQTGGTYTWSTGTTTNSIAVNPTTTTTYSVTYSLGACTPATVTAVVTVNPAPIITVNPITICSGETNTLTATPDQTGGTYAWSTGATTNSIAVNPTITTTYSVTYSLGACTPATATAVVTVNPAPIITVNPITICSGETNSLTATPDQSGGTYAWSNGATTASISINPTTNTTYSVTYSLGACTPATANATITVNPAPTVLINPITICSGETNSLTATPDQSGGTYAWSTGATSASITVNPTATTSYSVTYSLGACTPATSNATVTVNPAPLVSVTPITICSGETGNLTATPDQTGGTYAWSTGATTNSIAVNPTTTTTYSVTYSIGACTLATANAVVTVNPAPIITVNPITICSGETNSLTATPDQTGGTYAWSTGATTNSIAVNPTTTTSYSVTYSLGACTPATATAVVTVNPAPIVSINPITICSGETNTLTATPDQSGGTYAWSTGATTASISINPTTNTTYSVTYSLGACTPATATTMVTVNPAPTVSINPITICSGETGNLTATPDQTGGTYAWSTGATTNSISVNPTATTSYSVTYSLGACTPATATATVTVNPAPTVAINPITICSGETNTLTATPDQTGGTYAWSTGATTNSIAVNPTATTSYSVTYSLGACTSATASATVTVTPAPTLTVNSITICSGETNTLTATPSLPGGNYAWSAGVNTSTYTINPTTTTTYTVTYTLGACTPAIASGTITVNPTPTISITSPTICSGSSSSIVATPSVNGGSYSWSTGATTSSINVNPSTTTNYTVTYSINNCSVTGSTTLTVNPTPVITVNSSTICNGQTTTITANATPIGGNYLWSNAQNVNSIVVSPTSTSTYNVLYTLNGCNATANTTVTVNPIPQVTIASETICAGETIDLIAIPNLTGGTYVWSPGGSTTGTIAVNPTTTSNYSVVYTLNNCSSPSASATVVVNPVPVLTINSGSICTGQNFTLNATPSIPGGTFNWIPTGETTASITVSPLSTSTYSATYTTLEGCTSTISTGVVTISETPNVSFTASVTEGCAPLRVTFYNTTQATNDISNCVWALNTNSQLYDCDSVTYVFNQAGCYDVSLSTTANGCIGSNSQSAFICVENPPIASFEANPPTFTEINQTINFVNTSTGAVSYEWDFGDNSFSQLTGPMHYFEGTENGYTVSLTVTSSFGCTAEYQLPITYKEPVVYYIPNTFTPDADEHNQVFLPIFTSGIDFHNYLFQIYDRWGELIFETTNHLEGWDGSYGFEGRDVQQGTYVYRINFRSLNSAGSKTISGHVNLIK